MPAFVRTLRNVIRLRTTPLLCICFCVFAAAGPVIAAASEELLQISIPAGDLTDALDNLGDQSGVQIMYEPSLVAGIKVAAVSGAFTVRDALARLLAQTGLRADRVNDKTVVLRGDKSQEPAAEKPARTGGRSAASESEPEEPGELDLKGIPEVLVHGSRSLNMDITRTRDDPQPYVVLDRQLIERSGATSVEQLLQQRLPMNTSVASMGGAGNVGDLLPSSSGINLRGLGSGQTLILVDGHRMSSPMRDGFTTQGEITGIPLAAVERVEILPSTASGIYGGSATGGVINVITRKDYSGGEARVTYDNTFDSDSSIRKFDVLFGHNFNEGRTNILLSAGYSDANSLTEADRGFVARGREHMRRNNPEYYLDWANIPVSRLPNFASVDGSDLVLKSGEALGSPYGTVPAGYGGVTTDGGAALAGTTGQHDWALPDGVGGLGRELYTEPRVKSAGAMLRHRFNEGLQAFVDLTTSESERRHAEIRPWGIAFLLPEDSPYNPFTTAIQGRTSAPVQLSNFSRTDRDRAVVGIIKELFANWQMSLDYTWDRTRSNYRTAPRELLSVRAASAMDILRDVEAFPISIDPQRLAADAPSQMTMKDTSLRFSGPLGHLPGGRPVLSTALAYRDEAAPNQWQDLPGLDLTALVPARSASISSAYMEYRVPLFSAHNARPGLRELELQVAVRYENYVSRSEGGYTYFPRGEVPSPLPEISGVRNEFSSVDPTVALRWQPIADLALRVSYGTGFQPPNVGQLVPIVDLLDGSGWLVDPRRGGSSVGEIVDLYFGNPNLRPESSESWSAGVIFTPSRLPGLRLSVDYTRIEKTDNIGDFPGLEQGVLDREELFPGRVVRGPNLPGDPAGWAGPILQIDATPGNLASLKLEAWDVQLDYRWDAQARGTVDLFLAGTWQPKYALRVISGEPMVDYVGMGAQNPLGFKANAGLTWSLSALSAGWNVGYYDSYRAVSPDNIWEVERITANQGNGGRVPSQTYHDVFVNYDFSLSNARSLPGLLSATQLQLGIRNLFNKRPPVDMGAQFGHAYYSPFGSPRLASYYLTVTTRF